MNVVVKSETELAGVAGRLLAAFPASRIFAISGPMGAGKTTLIKALCRELGVSDTALSPTFSIINEYHLPDDTPVYHFDFYRINNLDEVYDIGYEEYFYSGNYCFLEWPELVAGLIPAGAVPVGLEVTGEESRVITF